MSFTWLTPLASLAGIAALFVVIAFVLGSARADRARRTLGLTPARRGRVDVVLAVAVVLVLALAAAQPAIARHSTQRVRSDAAVLVVVDVSRSMLASHGPAGVTRLRRAKQAALALRAEVGGVPSGIASLTDRVEPLLLPTADQATFDSTIRDALRVNSPPPLQIEPVATSFDALAPVGTQGFFARDVKRRVVVLLTDGESTSFDATSVAQGLAGASLVVIRIWSPGERVYDADGTPEGAYRPDPASAALTHELVSATGGREFTAGSARGAAGTVRRDLGTGPTRAATTSTRLTPLAPWIALASLVPLSVLARRRLLSAL